MKFQKSFILVLSILALVLTSCGTDEAVTEDNSLLDSITGSDGAIIEDTTGATEGDVILDENGEEVLPVTGPTELPNLEDLAE